jgi:RNA polymerase sigma-70 factor (ECF subfamily)
MTEQKQTAFMRLYQPVHPKLERFCKARVYGEMDWKDLLQDAVLIAYRQFDQLRAQEAFPSFIFGIALRVLANHRRKQRPQSRDLGQDPDFVHLGIESSERTQMDREWLYKALSRLPEQQREAILLFEISGFSIKEIAVLQESSESAIKQRLSRGRQQLLEQLQAFNLSITHLEP